ncbi:hypothetical protein Barb6XT_00873 [Bacteroidales bacterium Barb6XT]|nr:hypothetical protein Barb6XT_00873 [Bacteroidales bacterium Barb6XT]
MLIMSNVKERLLRFIKEKDINTSEFERKIGVSSGYVKNISKSIQPHVLEKIAKEFPDLNIEWMLINLGDMIRNSQSIGDISSSTVVGANVNGNGNSITHNEMDRMIDLQEKYIERLKKRDEQIDKLLDIINNMNKNK